MKKQQQSGAFKDRIIVKGAKEHNLKNIDLELPRNKFVVITGVSGSGKSSLAFDTIYAEGQRRYIECLSAYARQFLNMMEKPDVEFIDGLSPTISIEQKTASRNPRSTVGTITEIYDYIRLLYAKIAVPYCYNCGKPVQKQTLDQISDSILRMPAGSKIQILAPVVRGRKGHYQDLFKQLRKSGYVRVRIDGEVHELESVDKISRYKIHNIEVVVDRLVVEPKAVQRLRESLDQALSIGEGMAIVNHVEQNKDALYSKHLSCADCGIGYEEPFPKMFSFNSPFGACPKCDGLGFISEFDEDLVIPDRSLTFNEGAVVPFPKPSKSWTYIQFEVVLKKFKTDFETPIQKMSATAVQALLHGTGRDRHDFHYFSGTRKRSYRGRFGGVIGMLRHRYENSTSNSVRTRTEEFINSIPCDACSGARLKPEVLSYRLGDSNIDAVSRMTIKEAFEFYDSLKLSDRDFIVAEQILKEIRERLGFLLNVNLEYLTLDRSAVTLSGGESQRIRLAAQIGTQLVGVLYVLDEPSIGLHQRDNQKLIRSLKTLRDLGNTILVVEHDKETIESADHVVDIGPGAGRLGGRIIASGTHTAIRRSRKSLTGKYLSGRESIEIPAIRRKGKGGHLLLRGASGNNLKNLSVKFPLGKLICVTGVSGSGKSSLINETLYRIISRKFYKAKKAPLPYNSLKFIEKIDKIIDIDQSPIGRTPRSNPATYTGLFTFIRDLYAALPDSKMRGYKIGRFSFNVPGGRCEDCQGAGIKKIEMNFLPDVYVHCETCNGKRYNRETLDVRYRGKNISEVLEMTVAEALTFFDAIPRIKRKLQTLHDVGLDYIHLGQQATTLSGGEAQRVKLAEELSKISTGNTLYILDEPTTGLHFHDIKMLLNVLSALVDKGNTVIVIEHNLDVVKTGDWVIDLGPEGGHEGGYVVAEGTPEKVAANPDSHTGHFLKQELGL